MVARRSGLSPLSARFSPARADRARGPEFPRAAPSLRKSFHPAGTPPATADSPRHEVPLARN